MVTAVTFRFLNVTGSLQVAEDWDDPARLRLWRYHLHYFDDLNAERADARSDWHRALVARWVRENRPGAGTGWEPYPTSLRIVNWIQWAMAGQGLGASGLDAQALDSLAVQARWLRTRLENHLLGNHLWTNAKALIFAGVFFVGAEADRWLHKGLAILERELVEQILPDGGHFERSPMYHAILLQDVLDLINLAHVFPGPVASDLLDKLQDAAPRMLHWLRVMTHSDGGISFFNDAAFGIAADHAALAEYAQRLAIPMETGTLNAIEVLPDSGYVRLQNERAVVICDVAPVGPDYLPAHAHADTLSFELSLGGQRILVNGGTSTYEPGPERQRQRGTAAHNAVVIDGQDSSEIWGNFRVARRARPFGVTWGYAGADSWLEASHDGYQRLPGRVSHRRRWMLESDGLVIEDHLLGRFRSARAVLHLHPGVRPSVDLESGSAVVHLRWRDGAGLQLSFDPPVAVSHVPSTWHPEFGHALETTVLTATFESESLVTRLNW